MNQPLHAPPIGVITSTQPFGDELIDPSSLGLDRIKQLVYGDFGEGKSTYGATAPFCLFLSAESGEAALRKPWSPIDPRSRIYRVQVWDQMREVYQRIRTNWNGWNAFESIVVDSLSDLQEKCLFETMAEAEAKDPKRPKGVPQRNDYQIVTNKMKRMAVRFRDLDKNVIFIAQYRNDRAMEQAGGTTSRSVRADLTPAVYKGVAGYVDILSQIKSFPQIDARTGQPTGKMDRVMIFQDTSMQVAVKTRYRLPPYIINPTFQKLVDAIQESERLA